MGLEEAWPCAGTGCPASAEMIMTNRSPRTLTLNRIVGVAEWEAVEGSARNLSHHAAVLECAKLTRQHRQMWDRMANVNVELDSVLLTLGAKRIPFVLTGAHGIGGWTGVPRATQDVDILVKPGRNYTRAVNAIKALYPQLEIRQFAGVTAYFVPGEKKSSIDVTYPHRADLEETLQTAVWVTEGGHKYRVPALEAALANKYGAMLTLTRDPDKRAGRHRLLSDGETLSGGRPATDRPGKAGSAGGEGLAWRRRQRGASPRCRSRDRESAWRQPPG